MSIFGELGRRLRMLAGRRRGRRELEEEMRLHRELRGNEKKFGNELQLRERAQAQWGWTYLETWAQDARHGLRLLARTPLITALALVSLGLGIGATTALFTLANAVLLRPLPVSHPEQLMQVFTREPKMPRPSSSFTNPMWEQVRDHQDVFSKAFAWSGTQFSLRQSGERLVARGAYVSGDYFATLGIKAERGRLIGPRDDVRNCPNVADISDAFWHSQFGGSPAALGATLQLGGDAGRAAFTVIGVMPAGFTGTDVGWREDIAAPLCTERSFTDIRDAWWLLVMGRLKPDVSEAAAQARLQTQAPEWMAATVPPDWPAAGQQAYRARRMSLEPGGHGASWAGQRYGAALEVLLVIAGLILLVACANLAALMLARAAARRQELAVRRALGAGRGRLIRQLLTETALLALGGLGLGAAFAVWACGAAQALLKLQLALAPDARVLGVAIGAAGLTALLVGLAPALAASKGSSRRTAGRRAAVAAVAVALVLLASAALFLRSFANLAGAHLGFDPQQVALLEVSSPDPTQAPPPAIVAARVQALAALRALPGVRSASASFMIPTQGLQWDTPVHSRTGAIDDTFLNAISPGYFATLRTPVVAGRDFTRADRQGGAPVAIVNHSAARLLFPHGPVLGQELTQGDGKDTRQARVVGVVADARYVSVRDAPPPQVYFPLQQLPEAFPTTSFELRSSLPLPMLTREVKTAMAAADPAATYRIESFPGMLAGLLLPERMLAWLAGLFGGLALLLTAIGLYGIMAYSAERRKREFGIRMALGAQPRSVLRLALGDAGRVLALGIAIGAGLSWIAARAAQATLGKLLYGLHATDTATLAAAAALLAAVSLFAAWLPARRAARVDPMRTLREE
ncbi:MAG: ADOP family duplicated permease [Terriglobales bacterium]